MLFDVLHGYESDGACVLSVVVEGELFQFDMVYIDRHNNNNT